jgi:capsular exopolysaccharide synthesis family protein
MELRQYFGIVWKWSWLIALAVIIAAASSYLASRAATPIYRTSTTLMVGRVTQNPDPNSADLYTSQQLAYTYTQLARRELVLKEVLESLGLTMSWQALAGQVSAYAIPQTQLLEVSVIDADPYRAKTIADAIAQQLIQISPAGANGDDQEQMAFAETQLRDLKHKIETAQAEVILLRKELDASNSARQIQDLENQINTLDKKISDWQETYSKLLVTLQGGDVNTLIVVEEASIPFTPISPNVKMNVLMAAAIGLVLAAGGIFLIEYIDDTIKTSEDITLTQQLPVIGIIGRIEGKGYSEKLITAQKPLSPVVESFRALQINLQSYSEYSPLKVIMFSSAKPKAGKSVTIANLAVAMAYSGMDVVLVDADLRLPVIHEIYQLPNHVGLSDALLNNNSDVRKYLQATEIDNLRVLTSGVPPSNPSKALGTSRTLDVLEELKNEADVVLVDAPPLLSVADALSLGVHVDGVILVFREGSTRRGEARRAIDELRGAKVDPLGVILRKTRSRGENYSHYYYYAGNGTGKKQHKKPFLLFPNFRKNNGKNGS